MKNKEIEELLNKIKQQLITDEKLGKEIAKDFHETILNYEETKLLLSYIEQLEEFKKEHLIMKQILIENGLWEKLLNDDRFINYLKEDDNK